MALPVAIAGWPALDAALALAGIALNGMIALALAAGAAVLGRRIGSLGDRLSEDAALFWSAVALLLACVGLGQLAGAAGIPRIDRALFLACLLLQGALSAPVASFALAVDPERQGRGAMEALPLALVLAPTAAWWFVWTGGLGVYSIGPWGTDWWVNEQTALSALSLCGLVPGALLALAIPSLSFKAKSRLVMYRLSTGAASFLLALGAAWAEVVLRPSPWLLLPRAAMAAAMALAALGTFPPAEVRRGLH